MIGSILGMHFATFLTLAVISFIAAIFVHYIFRYRVMSGFDGFLWKWIIGWIGAWLGSPVLGAWFSHAELGHVYVLPALLGGFIGAFIAVFVLKAETQMVHRTS